MSIPELDKIIPVKPPKVNRKIKPFAKSIGVFNTILPPNIVAIQLKILIPVGTAIIIVALVKYARVSTSNPTVNIWCAQTIKPKKPIDNIA
jgi:antibiotic biosynthesis monooxygenase (ABM) superfamily enzyme